MRWDLFCRVVDNFGDVGVCWRLAADLASRGEAVRLWVDDASALAWMAPDGAAGVTVVEWNERSPDLDPQDVVVEAFGCDPPAGFVARMAAARVPPVWINLEYLSAEPYVERSHGLPSPQLSGPGKGLVKWFYFPGVVSGSGGLIREPGLLDARARFHRDEWLARRALPRRSGERVVSLFCYGAAPALARLLDDLARAPTLLLAAPGAALEQARAWSIARAPHPLLRLHPMPFLDQTQFDRLLWSCDLNVVRGEDSFARAQWAAVPCLWHIYPQSDFAHARKLDAWLDAMLMATAADAALAAAVRSIWRGWCGLGAWPARWPDAKGWAELAVTWCKSLCMQPDLTSQLLRFVESKSKMEDFARRRFQES